jgi:hypothetical protein
MVKLRCAPMPSPPFRGEREGARRVGDGEGEVGRTAVRSWGYPHLTPTLSAPKGGEEESDGVWGTAAGEGTCRSKS